MDHLIDNPSDVVGLELGPGDEPLLPGTLLPMRGVRATDNPPPTFSGSSMVLTGGGGGGGMLDAGGMGSGPDGEAYSGFPAAESGAGDTSGGAKSESMRRSVAGVMEEGGGRFSWFGFVEGLGVGAVLMGVAGCIGNRTMYVLLSSGGAYDFFCACSKYFFATGLCSWWWKCRTDTHKA